MFIMFASAMFTYSTLNLCLEEFTPERFVMFMFAGITFLFALQ